MNDTPHVRNGMGAVRAYLYGSPSLLDLVERAFEGEILERSPDGGEVEVRIADSVVHLALGERFPEGAATRSSMYVYVADADDAHAKAVVAGATSISVPERTSYGERVGAVRDAFGNIWYIATFLGDRPAEARAEWTI